MNRLEAQGSILQNSKFKKCNWGHNGLLIYWLIFVLELVGVEDGMVSRGNVLKLFPGWNPRAPVPRPPSSIMDTSCLKDTQGRNLTSCQYQETTSIHMRYLGIQEHVQGRVQQSHAQGVVHQSHAQGGVQ